jgi:hypothetical protein
MLTIIRRTAAFTATLYTLAVMLALAGHGSAVGSRQHATRAHATASNRLPVDSAPLATHYHVDTMTIVAAAPHAAPDAVKSAGPQMHCGAQRRLDSDATMRVRVCEVY